MQESCGYRSLAGNPGILRPEYEDRGSTMMSKQTPDDGKELQIAVRNFAVLNRLCIFGDERA
jgi:hypothetical protein